MEETIESLKEQLKQKELQLKEMYDCLNKGIIPIGLYMQFLDYGIQQGDSDDSDKEQLAMCEDFWNSTEAYQEKYGFPE